MRMDLEALGKKVGEKALDEFEYKGKTIREWAKEILNKEMTEDAISREAVLKLFATLDVNYLYEAILDLPSVQPEPKTGHWIAIDEEPHEDYECDKCGYTVSTYTANIEPHTEYKFCPNCGVKMEVEADSEVTE